MTFVPRDFVIPEPPATHEFLLTPPRVDHVVLDYEAVMAGHWPFSTVDFPGHDRPRPTDR
jgi:hypothetical protein